MGTELHHGQAHSSQRPRSKAVIDEALLSGGFLVAGGQKTLFIQMLAPEASKQRRSLSSRDVRPPGALRELPLVVR